MSSLLTSKKDKLKKLTHTIMISNGFDKSNWGAPTGRYKNGNAKWSIDRKMYEYHLFGDVYHGVIYYFPPRFTGYVTSFRRINTNPAGHFLIFVDDDGDKWYEIKRANTVFDMEMAKTILTTYIKELEE